MMKTPLLFLLTATALASPFTMDWWTADGGGGTSSGGGFELTGTIGQPDAGKMVGGAYEISGGFWSGWEAIQTADGPPLSIRQSAAHVILSWPLSANGWTLQTSLTMTTGSWTNVAQAVVDTATEHTVTVPRNTAEPKRFFRLAR
jgi:hypothetical protein